jgi:hypothetical protein
MTCHAVVPDMKKFSLFMETSPISGLILEIETLNYEQFVNRGNKNGR